MSTRDRIRKYLDREITQGMLISSGALPTDGISVFAYIRLLKILGHDATKAKVYDVFQFLAEIDLQVLDRLCGDFVQVHRMRYRFGISEKTWKSGMLQNGEKCLFPSEYDPKPDMEGSLVLYMNGGPCACMPENGLYFDQIGHPLQGITDPSQLRNYHPADDMANDEIDYIVHHVDKYYADTDKGIVLIFGGSIFDQAQRDFGSEDFYCNLAAEPELMHTHFQNIADANIRNMKRILDRCGNRIDVIHFFDDIGSQNTLLISPQMYRNLIKPYHHQQCQFIKNNYPNIKILMHCCGAIFDLIPEFIEIGVDLLNPVQISASGMDPKALKKKYHNEIMFWGGGVNTQRLDEMRDLDELRSHVDSLCSIFSEDGGFVFSPVHNLQANVAPEAILAIYDTASKYH